MDKNIAAFLREDAYTVTVAFQTTTSEAVAEHVYATTIAGLEVGNMVVVPYQPNGPNKPVRLSVATVMGVQEDLDIQPNSERQYRWVHSKVDNSYYNQLLVDNDVLQSALNTAYRSNLKRSYAAQMLAGLDDATRLTLDSVLARK